MMILSDNKKWGSEDGTVFVVMCNHEITKYSVKIKNISED